MRFGCVLADAGYGLSASFRQALSERGLLWAVGIPRQQKVYPANVSLIFPVADMAGRGNVISLTEIGCGRDHARRCDSGDRHLAPRHERSPVVPASPAMRVRVADGPPQRIGDIGGQHMPGEEVWLVGERRADGERKYYLSNLPADTTLKTLAATIKARWICEQAHQQLKEELGLDHFEGGPGQGYIDMP